MSKLRNVIPIKKVLPEYIGAEKSDLYLKGLNFTYIDAQDIYEKSLNALIEGSNDECLKIMIFGLDRDRSYTPLLNLCRTMLFGLSDLLNTNDFETYKHKYKNFKNAKSSLSGKIKGLQDKINDLEDKLEEIQDTSEDVRPTSFISKKLYLFYRMTVRKLEPSKQQYAFEKDNCEAVIEKLRSEISDIDKLIELEDVVNILKLVVEICTVPIRFEWAIAKSD